MIPCRITISLHHYPTPKRCISPQDPGKSNLCKNLGVNMEGISMYLQTLHVDFNVYMKLPEPDEEIKQL